MLPRFLPPTRDCQQSAMEAYHSSLRLRQQSNPLHAGIAGDVNYVRHIFEINIIVAAHKRYAFRANLKYVVQPALQILPLDRFLIDLEYRRLVLSAPDHLNHNRSVDADRLTLIILRGL